MSNPVNTDFMQPEEESALFKVHVTESKETYWVSAFSNKIICVKEGLFYLSSC